MDRESFDSKEGIVKRLGSMDDLRLLMQERNKYGDNEQSSLHANLNEYVILGHLHLDRIGCAWSMYYQGCTSEKCAKLPSVMTRKEFDQLRHKWHGMYVIDPPIVPRLPCRLCGKAFALEDIGRMHREATWENLDLTPFTGQTLADIEKHFAQMNEVECVFDRPIYVSQGGSNERQRIDSKLPWVEEMVTREQYVVKSGDHVKIGKWQFEHSACTHQNYKATLDSPQLCKSYADFANLLWLRYKFASKKRSPDRGSLARLVFLGHYYSDEFGRCRRFRKDVIPESVRTNLPFVMPHEDFLRVLKTFCRSNRRYQEWPALAPKVETLFSCQEKVCARCDTGFTLEDCVDVEVEGLDERVDLTPYIGQTLKTALFELQGKKDAWYEFGSPLRIQNPRWQSEEFTQWLGLTEEERKQVELHFDKSDGGWRDESNDDFPISLNSVVWPGDVTDVFCYRSYHEHCYRQLQESRVVSETDENHAFIRSLFYAAGFESVRFIRAPLPMHQRKWLERKWIRYTNRQNPADAALNAFRYYRVETAEGCFALLKVAEDWIDLHGTGIRISEIEQGLQSPGNLPPMFTFKTNVDRLVRFRTLLQKRNSVAV